jgi:acyl-CoA reductase-like NAD-dependent aldehyde dehydrogenase
MCIMRFDTDEQAVELANDCTFALGSSVFSGSPRRARWLAKRIRAGMVSINDFNATYMCQVGEKLPSSLILTETTVKF